MNSFDKFCAVLACILAVVFMLQGAFGVLFGCSAHYALPPILGVAPAFFGWGIFRAVRVAWNVPVQKSLAYPENDFKPPKF